MLCKTPVTAPSDEREKSKRQPATRNVQTSEMANARVMTAFTDASVSRTNVTVLIVMTSIINMPYTRACVWTAVSNEPETVRSNTYPGGTQRIAEKQPE